MGGAGRSMGRRSLAATGPLPSSGRPKRIDDAPQQSVAHGHVHDAARALDFIARVQMPVVAEQNHADFVLVHVERDAEHIAGKLHQLLKAHTGKPETLAMPVATLVIVPTSRGASCGVNASRAWPIPANAPSKTLCKLRV